MKNLKLNTTILTLTILGLMAISCKENQKNSTDNMHSEMSMEGHDHNNANSSMHDHQMTSLDDMAMNAQQSNQTKEIISSYMAIKDALVADDGKSAAAAVEPLESALNNFKVEDYSTQQQSKLNDIINDAKEHAEHISMNQIDHQREQFKMLSKDVLDMVAITGAEGTVYELYCPMYDNGSSWLSMSKDIRNPFYGSKMLKCGRVEREIK